MPRLSKKRGERIRKRIEEGELLENILSNELSKHVFYLVSYMNDETKEGIAGAYFRDGEANEFIHYFSVVGNEYIIAEDLIKKLVNREIFHGFSKNYLNEEETKKVYQFLEDNL